MDNTTSSPVAREIADSFNAEALQQIARRARCNPLCPNMLHQHEREAFEQLNAAIEAVLALQTPTEDLDNLAEQAARDTAASNDAFDNRRT